MAADGLRFLRLRDITKQFPGALALDQASLDFAEGEIHGLVGENGAGKSTIIKILAGVYRADGGTIEIDGQARPALTPAEAQAAGIRFIHQELQFVPHLTVAETIFLGQEITGPFGLRRSEMERRAAAFCADHLGFEVEPSRLIRDLPVSDRKMVQIARGLIDGGARLVVLDEPTAPLDESGKARLFKALTSLKQRGVSILYVSHYLNEITQLCDRVSVFRNGRNVREFANVAPDAADAIVAAMLGQALGDLYPQRQSTPGKVVLDVTGLSRGTEFQDVSLSVREGEIVGIAGLVGSGRESLIDTLYGHLQASAGEIRINGKRRRRDDPALSVAAGLGLVPRDRRGDGLVLDMTTGDNISLASLDAHAVFGLYRPAHAARVQKDLITRLDIRPAQPEITSRNLSGGNQQKTVLARWFAAGTRIFILDNPTVGVDLGARKEIYRQIAELAVDGAAIIVASEDPSELLGLSDRILVMVRGRLVGDDPVSELTLEKLVASTTDTAVRGTQHAI